MTATSENKEVYRRFVEEVINGGSIRVIPELFSPDYVDHSAPPGASSEGSVYDQIAQVPKMFRGAFPDVHFAIEDMVEEGDWVATRVTGSGTNQGPLMGAPPSGRKAVWASMGFFRVADGKIAEHWGSPDLLSLLTQIGVIPGGSGTPAEIPPPMAAPPHGEPNPAANKAVERSYVENMFNKHDLTGLENMLDPNYVYHAMGLHITGVEGYKSTVYPLFKAFPDVENNIQQLIGEGDLVATRWSAHGTHNGEFMGIAPTGRQVALTGMTIERIVDGKRIEGWGVPDMVGLMAQLGVGPGASGPPKE
jgi:predicted ester cyclase